MNFFPHGHCYRWDPLLIGVSAGADLAVALAYYLIPVALLLVRWRSSSRAVVPRPLLVLAGLFAAFIVACGMGHLIAIATIWKPLFWLEAGWKVVIAAISLYTAYQLYSARDAFNRAVDAIQREFQVDNE